MNDNQKAMLLNISFAAYEAIREKEQPRSARFSRLTHSINRLLTLVDIYRRNVWPNVQMAKAEALIDEFNLRLAQVFSGDHLPAGLNVAFAAFETVRAEERPGSERYKQLSSGIDRLLELADIFNPQEWSASVERAAGELADEFKIRIAEVFGDQPKPEGKQA